MKPLFVIDIETTDLDPEKGQIVEVGIARVDLVKKRVYPEYSKIVRQSACDFSPDSWVFKNSTLTSADVIRSPWTMSDVMLDLVFYQRLGMFTSYNQAFDFVWLTTKLGLDFWTVSDIMDLCTDLNGQRLSAQGCYYRLCQDNPANLPNYKEEHRALSDAVMESYILLAVCDEEPKVRGRILDALMRD